MGSGCASDIDLPSDFEIKTNETPIKQNAAITFVLLNQYQLKEFQMLGIEAWGYCS
jgi:hypothetical protein